MPSDDAQRTALAHWLEDQRPALEQQDWGEAFKTYPRLNLGDWPIPWTPFTAEMRSARVALVTSAGLYIEGGQEPFDAADPYGDYTYRIIAAATPTDRLRIAHDHYDHTSAMQDINAVYPLQPLRDLAREGAIGGVVDPIISFMGYEPDWRIVEDSLAPALADEVTALRPDAALLIPV